MSGICGIFDTRGEGRLAKRSAAAGPMLAAMAHRGPDDEGVYESPDGNCVLGQRRLAIIDAATGRQPVPNETGRIWAVFNGEIYNYVELRKKAEKLGHAFKTSCDTGVIPHLYEAFGRAFPAEMNGMFAAAVYDEDARALVLVRDRAGVKPLHYALSDGLLYFASEMKAILAALPGLRSVSSSSLCDYLVYGYVMAPNSIYPGIKKAMPATVMTFAADGTRAEFEYWRPRCAPEFGRPKKSFADEFLLTLNSAVKMRMNADVPLGACLSGGLDSSAVVAMMSRASSTRVKTFSVGYDEEEHDSLRHAALVAGHFDCEHYPLSVRSREIELVPRLVWHLDEPLSNPSLLPFYQMSQVSSRHVRVALTGDGADELFGGHERYLWEVIAEGYMKIPRGLRKNFIERLVKFFPSSTDNYFEDQIRRIKKFIDYVDYDPNYRYLSFISPFSGESLRALMPDFDAHKERAVRLEKTYENELSDAYFESWLSRVLYCDFRYHVANDLLVMIDRMSMANSQECRAPFLDYRMVELAMKMPIGVKIRGVELKHIMRHALRDVLPQQVVSRPGRGFAPPIGAWFRGDLRELLMRTLLSPDSFVRSAFDPAYVRNLAEMHAAGARNNALQLWNLFILEIWHRIYIRNRGEGPLTFMALFD